MVTVCIVVCSVLALAAGAPTQYGSSMIKRAKPFPTYPEQFEVHTVESDPEHGVVLKQTLIWDISARRSRMIADGTLVGGHLEEIRRCDIEPMGWSVQFGGPAGTQPSEWKCVNMSVNPAPDYCQWSNFWDIPSNATYAGTDKVNGVLADKWVYWSGGDEFAFWGTATSPLKTAKTDAAVPGQVEWAIDFVDFVPGPPVLEKFQPTAGVQCPPAGRRGPSGRPSVTRKGRILGVVNN